MYICERSVRDVRIGHGVGMLICDLVNFSSEWQKQWERTARRSIFYSIIYPNYSTLASDAQKLDALIKYESTSTKLELRLCKPRD